MPTETKLNKRLLRKVRNRIAKVPESYDQGNFIRFDNKAPCGTAECLAGETVICAAPSIKQGIESLRRSIAGRDWDTLLEAPPVQRAKKLLGLTSHEANAMFGSSASDWPEPFAARFGNAREGKLQAKVAVAYLDECLRRGKVTW